jgi:hypothetical protein
MEDLYADLSTELLLKSIEWLDENTNGWPFDKIRAMAVKELEGRK